MSEYSNNVEERILSKKNKKEEKSLLALATIISVVFIALGIMIVSL